MGLPLFAVVSDSQPPLGAVDAVGVALWAVGFAIEAIADRQLSRFRVDPTSRGLVFDSGLWRFSRHPNYFGDALQWTGLGVLGVAAGEWWALLSPVMMLAILLRISGIAVMDQHLRASRGDKYDEYVRTTSAFVPLPRRSSA